MGFFSNLRNRVGEWWSPSRETMRSRDFQIQIVTPLTQVREMIRVSRRELQRNNISHERVITWTQKTNSDEQVQEIRKQLAQHDKQSWLVRRWKEVTGQVKDIPNKRLWLAFYHCEALSMYAPISSYLDKAYAPEVHQILQRSRGFIQYYPYSWQRVLQRLRVARYLQTWPQPKSDHDISSTKRSQSQSSQSSSQFTNEVHPDNRKEAVLSDALVVFIKPPTASEDKKLRLMLFACGFFNINWQTATPNDIHKKLRSSYYIEAHLDQVDFKFTDLHGNPSSLPEEARAHHVAKMTELFQYINERFGEISNSDLKLQTLAVNLSAREINEIVCKGRSSRQFFDQEIVISEEVTSILAHGEQYANKVTQACAKITKEWDAIDQGCDEINQINREIRTGLNDMAPLVAEVMILAETYAKRQKQQCIQQQNSEITHTQTNGLFVHRDNRPVIPFTIPAISANISQNETALKM